MPMYANIDGARKEIKLLYNNINGSQKKNKSYYANIQGASKQIYSQYYAWRKYNVITNVTPGTFERFDVSAGGWNFRTDGQGSEKAFYTSESNMQVYDNKYIKLTNLNWIDEDEYTDFQKSLSGKVWAVYLSTHSWSGGVGSSSVIYDVDELYYGAHSYNPNRWSDQPTGWISAQSRYRITSAPEYNYSQGSTYYGLVFSTNRTAYPDNGKKSDGYWYVFAY